MKEVEFLEKIKKNRGELYIVGNSVVDLLFDKPSKRMVYCVLNLSQKQISKLFGMRKKTGHLFTYEVLVNKKICDVIFSPSRTIFDYLETVDITVDALAIEVRKGFKVDTDEIYDPFQVLDTIQDRKLEPVYQDCEEEEIEEAFREYTGQIKDKRKLKVLTNEELQELDHQFMEALEKGLVVKGVYYKKNKQQYLKSQLAENPLSIYKLAKKAATYQFELSDDLVNMILQMKEEMINVSEREVLHELKEVLGTEKPSVFFECLDEWGVLGVHFAELKKMKEKNDGNYVKTLKAIDEMKTKDEAERLAVLLHLVKKEHIRQFIKRFRLPEQLANISLFVSENYMKIHKLTRIETLEIVKMIAHFQARQTEEPEKEGKELKAIKMVGEANKEGEVFFKNLKTLQTELNVMNKEEELSTLVDHNLEKKGFNGFDR